MADQVDIAQERTALHLENQINKARIKPGRESAQFCEACGVPIPAARRLAVPGVTLCVACQEVTELKNKHYRGAAL